MACERACTRARKQSQLSHTRLDALLCREGNRGNENTELVAGLQPLRIRNIDIRGIERLFNDFVKLVRGRRILR